MEIRERIAYILKHEKLSASLFADRIGVQRSSISHVLSGRNKPSLDYLQKILQNFSSYNAEWLVMGIGEPIKGLIKPKQNLFTATEPNSSGKSETTDIISKNVNKPIQDSSESRLVEPETIPTPTTIPIEVTMDKKAIDKIIVLYKDGSFKAYSSE